MAEGKSQQEFVPQEQVEGQEQFKELIRGEILKIFADRKADAAQVAKFEELGANPDQIQKFQDAARAKEVAAAELLKAMYELYRKKSPKAESATKAPDAEVNDSAEESVAEAAEQKIPESMIETATAEIPAVEDAAVSPEKDTLRAQEIPVVGGSDAASAEAEAPDVAGREEVAAEVAQETPAEVPQVEPEPAQERIKEPNPLDALSPVQKKDLANIEASILKLKAKYDEADPSKWMELVSDPNFAFLQANTLAKNPEQFKAAKRWFEGLVAKQDIVDLKARWNDFPGNLGSGASYYERLGVPEDASEADIKAAFRKGSDIFHPDKYTGVITKLRESGADTRDAERQKSESEARSKRIAEAYETLKDAAKRKQYDRMSNQQAQPRPDQQGRESGFPHQGDYQQRSNERAQSPEVTEALNKIRNAPDLWSIKEALSELAQQNFYFERSDRWEDPRRVAQKIRDTEDFVNKGGYNPEAFKELLAHITGAESIRQRVEAHLEPIRQSLENLDKVDISIPDILVNLNTLVQKNFVFVAQRSGQYAGLRYPSEMIRDIQAAEAAQSPQEAMRAVEKITSLYDLHVKVLHSIQTRNPRWSWQGVQVPDKVARDWPDFKRKRNSSY